MTFLRAIIDLFTGWATLVASAIVEGVDRLVSPRVVRLTEQPDGDFIAAADGKDIRISFAGGKLAADTLAQILRGSRIEISLQASRFVFRTVELPVQAADFLEGVVRAQIDRLTPWTASGAVFGCSAPTPIDQTKISALMAATPRPMAMSYVDAALAFEPASVAVLAETSDATHPIKVYEQKASAFLNVPQLSRALLTLLVATGAAALVAAVTSFFLNDRYDTRLVEVNRDIGELQARLRAGATSADQAALQLLSQRKYETAAVTITLEALSRILPDNTYATEMHIAGKKLQVVGISRDVPSLIRLIEQSPHFTRATFFAPTTRSASDPGERFHIEVGIETQNTLNP